MKNQSYTSKTPRFLSTMASGRIDISGNMADPETWIVPYMSEDMEIDLKELPADIVQCPNSLARKLLGRREIPMIEGEPEEAVPV